ncbi:MAG: TRAP transporter substrate-binding protein [Arenicella sp.]
MKKIKILTAFFFVVLSVCVPSLASSQTYEWRLAETWPKDFPLFGDAVKKMAAYTKQLSNGRLLINIVSSEQHKQPQGIFELVQDEGGFEMGHSASYYWKDRDVNMLFFTTLPFGMTTVEQYSWFYNAGGLELMQKAYEPYGLMSFPGGNTGNQMGGWFRKEIKTVSDLKGIKMSMPGLAGDVIETLGVNTVNIAPDRLYGALKSGEIDALEWVGPSLDLDLKFHEIAPFYYTGWNEPATELQFLVNKAAFEKLPLDLQNILTLSMRLAAYDTYIAINHASINNLDRLLADYPNVRIRAFPRDVMTALRKATVEKIYELAKDGGQLTSEIVTSLFSYKDKARFWTRISDQSYLNNTGF